MRHKMIEDHRAMEPYLYWYLLGVAAGKREAADYVAKQAEGVPTAGAISLIAQDLANDATDQEAGAKAFKPKDEP